MSGGGSVETIEPPEEGPPISVALVNDQPLVVAGLARMLRENSRRIQIAEVELNGSRVGAVDIALFDLADGERVNQRIEDLRSSREVGSVVIYTWQVDAEFTEIANADHTVKLIPKTISGRELVHQLHRIADGERARRGPELTMNMLPPHLLLDLSPRERDVAIGVAEGRTNRMLAEQTGLSENTVKTYIVRAMQKTGTRNRASLAAWAAHHGLISFD